VTYGAVARRGSGWLPLISLTGLTGTLCTLALPAVLGRAIDAIVTGADSQRWLAVAAGLVVLAVIMDVAEVPAETACVAGTTAWLRNRLVRHVLAIGPQGARRFGTGDVVSRVSGNAVDAAQAGPAAVTVAAAGLRPLGSLALLAWIDPWLAVTFLAGVVFVALVLRAFTRRTAEVIGSYQRIQGDLAARLTESLAGARTIAAAGTAGQEQRRVLEALPRLHAEGVRTWRVLARSSAQAAVVGPLVLVGVLAAGGLLLGDGRISTGELLAASRYAVLGAGLGSLTGVTGRMARARAGVRRAAEVLAVDPVRYGSRTLPAGSGQLELRAVTVREGANVLLDNADLDLPGGTLVAVAGRSGAGKSTLAAVAARLRDPDSGQVLLDGVPLPDLAHDALRTAVGCAFERPVLVGGTVADAVGLGQERELVHAATRATSAHEFVSRLPQGYDTPLDDAPMSGGEAQRLGLARAWHASRLLVLDDATSGLDMVTEMRIGQALDARDECTRLVVTHRAATAARADLVVWLDAGRVRAVGPHSRLWSDPDYREVFA
jgi:ATP-binding cassette subfamily B protein